MLQDPVKQQFTVKHNGLPLQAGRYADLAEVAVELDISKPSMAVLRFRDTSWSGGESTEDLLASLGWAHGHDIEILAPKNPAGDDAASEKTIFKGEITALEFDHSHSGRHALIRAYDKSHRLHSNRTTKAYPQAKDSNIFSKVAGAAGVPIGKNDDTGTVHDHMPQINQTDYEFLRWRAEENGYVLMTDDQGRLCFCKPPNTSGPTLHTDQDLWAFRPRLLAPSFTAIDVKGWDTKQKQAMKAHGEIGDTKFASLKATPAGLAGKLGGGKGASVTKPGLSQSELDKLAASLAERHSQTFAEAEGMALGNADLRPGVTVDVKGVGATHDGKYQITSARHVLNHQGYRTYLGFSGLNDRSALALSSDGQASTPRPGKVFGLVVGIVTEVGKEGDGHPEAENETLVKVKFPWLDDSFVTSWCRTMQFGGGNGRGALFLPEVGDEVVVGFEHGDVRSPFVLGGLYGGVDKPNPDLGGSSLLKGGKVIRRGYRSPNKHGLTFEDDKGGKDGITLITGDTNFTIQLDQTNTKIVINSKTGDVEIEANKAVKITSKTSDISLEANAGNLNMKAQAVKIEASTNMDLKANASFSAQGANTKVSGQATLDLEASGIAQLKGGMVKIN